MGEHFEGECGTVERAQDGWQGFDVVAVLLITGYVALDKPLYCSMAQFPHLWNGNGNTYLTE